MSIFSLTCYLLSLIIYIVYLCICLKRYGSKMDCISSTFYLNKRKWIFGAIIISISFLILPSWLEISGDNYTFLAFLSTLLLSIVGICPKYLGDERRIHLASVALSCILSLIWNIVSGTYVLPIIGLILLLLYKVIFNVKDLALASEVMGFANIYTSIIFKAFLM